MNQKLELTKKLLPENTSEKILLQYYSLWWKDRRANAVGGLQLTEEGFDALIASGIKSYRVKFDEAPPPTNQMTIWLNRFMDCPFYITKKEIYVFGERMAIQLMLFSGNIEQFARSKANKLKNPA
jgi:hypothetical protein